MSSQWRTTKTHTEGAMLDCYRLIFFAFCQPHFPFVVDMGTNEMSAELKSSSDQSTVRPYDVNSSSPPAVSAVKSANMLVTMAHDENKKHHRRISISTCDDFSDLYLRHVLSLPPIDRHSPDYVPYPRAILCGTLFEVKDKTAIGLNNGNGTQHYFMKSRKIAHIPTAFVEGLFKRFGDYHSLHYDPERGVGSVLYATGEQGEHCYVSTHLSTILVPTIVEYRDQLIGKKDNNRCSSETDGDGATWDTAVHVTAFLEFAYYLPFVNPFLITFRAESGTINRNLLRTFPIPVQDGCETTAKAPVVGNEPKKQSDSHSMSCRTASVQASSFVSPTQLVVSTTTASSLESSKLLWVYGKPYKMQNDSLANVNDDSLSGPTTYDGVIGKSYIDFPHSEVWASIIHQEQKDVLTLESVSEIPQAMVEVLLGINHTNPFDQLLKIHKRQNEEELGVYKDEIHEHRTNYQFGTDGRAVVINSTPVEAIVGNLTLIDLWVLYVCRYVLWKRTDSDTNNRKEPLSAGCTNAGGNRGDKDAKMSPVLETSFLTRGRSPLQDILAEIEKMYQRTGITGNINENKKGKQRNKKDIKCSSLSPLSYNAGNRIINDESVHTAMALICYRIRLSQDPCIPLFNTDVKIHVRAKSYKRMSFEERAKYFGTTSFYSTISPSCESDSYTVLPSLLDRQPGVISCISSRNLTFYKDAARFLPELQICGSGDDLLEMMCIRQQDAHETQSGIGNGVLSEDFKNEPYMKLVTYNDMREYLSSTSIVYLALQGLANADEMQCKGLLDGSFHSQSKLENTVDNDKQPIPRDAFSAFAILMDEQASSGSVASLYRIVCPSNEFWAQGSMRSGSGVHERKTMGIGGYALYLQQRYSGVFGMCRIVVDGLVGVMGIWGVSFMSLLVLSLAFLV